jgi:hypothetical protein
MEWVVSTLHTASEHGVFSIRVQLNSVSYSCYEPSVIFVCFRNNIADIYIFSLTQLPPVGKGLLIHAVSRSHTKRRTTVGRTPLDVRLVYYEKTRYLGSKSLVCYRKTLYVGPIRTRLFYEDTLQGVNKDLSVERSNIMCGQLGLVFYKKTHYNGSIRT